MDIPGPGADIFDGMKSITKPMTTRFAGRVFTIAGVYGLLVLAPQYFMLTRIGRDNPPPITHPEYFYGFIGVAIAWNIGFLVIGRDPVRFRTLMIPAILEKLAFSVPAAVLYAQKQLAAVTLGFGMVDVVLGALFVIAYLRTGQGEPRASI